jgi:hypothetical protein
MNNRSPKRINAPITPEEMPVTYQAVHAGMKVMRYFSDPMRMKREAEPINEITRAVKTLTIMLVIIIFLKRFLRAVSAPFRDSPKMAFTSLNNALIISFIVGT